MKKEDEVDDAYNPSLVDEFYGLLERSTCVSSGLHALNGKQDRLSNDMGKMIRSIREARHKTRNLTSTYDRINSSLDTENSASPSSDPTNNNKCQCGNIPCDNGINNLQASASLPGDKVPSTSKRLGKDTFTKTFQKAKNHRPPLLNLNLPIDDKNFNEMNNNIEFSLTVGETKFSISLLDIYLDGMKDREVWIILRSLLNTLQRNKEKSVENILKRKKRLEKKTGKNEESSNSDETNSGLNNIEIEMQKLIEEEEVAFNKLKEELNVDFNITERIEEELGSEEELSDLGIENSSSVK